jgi:hypothetical protein
MYLRTPWVRKIRPTAKRIKNTALERHAGRMTVDQSDRSVSGPMLPPHDSNGIIIETR